MIRRSILRVLLYRPSPVESRMYNPELFYSCLYGEVGRSGVQLELPLYLDQVVVDLPPCAMMARA